MMKNKKKPRRKSSRNSTKSGDFDAPIVTILDEMKIFYPAEDYHEDYVA
jgi:peptide-methionine (S)-S-oxide reductase